MDLSLTAHRFRTASRRRGAAAILWISLILAGLCPSFPCSELWLAWGLLLSAWFLRCVEWRTARNGRFTRKWVENAWKEALRLQELRLVAESYRRTAAAGSTIASRAWMEEVNRNGGPRRTTWDREVEQLDAGLTALSRREEGILDLRRVTLEFRGEAWLLGALGFLCALAGLLGWGRGGGALAGCALLMSAAYLSHTAKATALGGP